MANTTIIQQNNINFTVDTRINRYTGWGKKYSNANNIGDTSYPADPSSMVFGMNAIEIDWNDAELGEVNGIPLGTIKTTGDLIKVIQG